MHHMTFFWFIEQAATSPRSSGPPRMTTCYDHVANVLMTPEQVRSAEEGHGIQSKALVTVEHLDDDGTS